MSTARQREMSEVAAILRDDGATSGGRLPGGVPVRRRRHVHGRRHLLHPPGLMLPARLCAPVARPAGRHGQLAGIRPIRSSNIPASGQGLRCAQRPPPDCHASSQTAIIERWPWRVQPFRARGNDLRLEY